MRQPREPRWWTVAQWWNSKVFYSPLPNWLGINVQKRAAKRIRERRWS